MFLLTSGYFAVGGAAMRVINRGAAERERSERWTKFAVYFLIVHAVILAILSGAPLFGGLAGLLVALGLFELLRVAASSAGSPRTLAAALPFYAAFAFAFLRFARASSPRTVLSPPCRSKPPEVLEPRTSTRKTASLPTPRVLRRAPAWV